MNRPLHSIVFSILAIICLNVSYSQFHLIKKADEQYRKFEYIDAQQSYLKAIAKGAKSSKVFENLGNSYYYNGEYKEASKWYHELIEAYPNETDPEYYYRYAQTLRSDGKYDEADMYMGAFSKLKPLDSRGRIFLQNKDYLKEIDSFSNKYLVRNLSINSRFTDFGPSYFGDEIVFSSSRKHVARKKQIHQWNKESYLDLFKASYDADSTLGRVQKWNENFNSEFHDSSPVFTNDGKTIYFTRNNIEGEGDYEQVRTYRLRTDKLKIYRSHRNSEGIWSEPETLPFNSDYYSVAHPALNPKENILYFASDMPGGYGGSDLYEVTIHSDGSFGTPKNLGTEINTEGKETFPFISQSNTLYFASDARGGLGGLDIYMRIPSKKDSSEYHIYNLGKPINTTSDDFALIIDDNKKSGFFSSNRPGGIGKDDIYSFIDYIPEPKPFEPGEDLALTLNLDPIYFDLDKSFIRKDAAIELDKIVKILKEHPSIKINIRSHTDSRASHRYNIQLSQRRAKSTEEYLISHGIKAERLSRKGFGETQLLNECKDGVYCSEKKHQLNRRSEFIVVEM